MGRRTGLREGRRSPNSRLLPRAAVAGPTAWMRSSTRIQQKITRPASARRRVAFADLCFRRSQLVAGGLSAAPVSRLVRWRPISVDESRSQGGEKLSNRDLKTTHTFRSLLAARRPSLFKPNSPNIGSMHQPGTDGLFARSMLLRKSRLLYKPPETGSQAADDNQDFMVVFRLGFL